MKKNGKIAIDARMVNMSGIGTYIRHLLGRGIYDVALGEEEEIRKFDRDVQVIPYPAKIYSPQEQILFPEPRLRREGVNLIHFPHYNVPFSCRIDYVVTVHDLIHIIFPQYMKNRIAAEYAKILMTNSLRRSSHVFTVSEYSKKDLISFFSVPDTKITVTCNAADHRFCRLETKQYEYLDEKYGITGKKAVLFVGNLKPHKNVKTLIRAFDRIRRDDTVLILAGKEFNDDALAESLSQNPRIVRCGMVSDDELVALYNRADIFAFPSLYEGFGIPPLEAMACGTPVVCSNASSIPEVVGDAALISEPEDDAGLAENICRLLDDPVLKETLIQKGYRRITRFSWDKTVERTVEVIRMIQKP